MKLLGIGLVAAGLLLAAGPAAAESTGALLEQLMPHRAATNFTPAAPLVLVNAQCDAYTSKTCQYAGHTWCCPKTTRCVVRDNDTTGGGVSGACMP
jgi:hypothetical protein